jgi:hypothetical protein
VTEIARFTLPAGTIVHQIGPGLSLAMVPHAQGKSLVDFYLFDLYSGSLRLLTNQPAGWTRGYPDSILYDGRASETLLIWTECDIATLAWQVYVAPINPDGLGAAFLVDEGGPDYEVPLLAIAGNKAYWTVMPNPDGPAQYNDSYLKAMVFGQREPWVVHTSHGRMITSPMVNQGTLSFAPRVDTKNVYYQLTALNTIDDRVRASAIMPQSVRPFEAIYLDGAFCFSIEYNYPYADGLGSFGTYLPLSAGKWLHLGRKPSAPPASFSGHLVVKSAISVIGIDAASQTYYSIPAVADSADYGDVLAGWGAQDRLVVFSNVRSNTTLAIPECVIRVFEPV